VKMIACKQSSSSPLIPFISLLVIRVRLMRITEVIAYQTYVIALLFSNSYKLSLRVRVIS
jgi:hypothetical protein